MKPELVLLLFLAAGCIAPTPDSSVTGEAAAPSREDPSVALARLSGEAWENLLRFDPVFATRQNDRRYDGDLPDRSPSGVRRELRAHRILLDRVTALDAAGLSPEERLTQALLAEWLANQHDTLATGEHAWRVDPLEGPQNAYLTLAEDQPLSTAAERAALVERWRAMGLRLRQAADDLSQARAQGRVATRHAVTVVVEQLDRVLKTPVMDSPLVAPALGGGTWIPLQRGETVSAVAHRYLGSSRHQAELRRVNRHLQKGEELALGTRILLPSPEDPLSPDERGLFLESVLQVVEREVYPGFARYRSVLRDEVLPQARGDDRPGISHVPGGAEAYRVLARAHTSTDLSPREIHEIGLAEVKAVRAEMAELGARLFGTADLTELQERLRGDPAMHFAAGDEVLAAARTALARAEAAAPAAFGRLPRARCTVVEIPPHEAPASTVAYYREPAADGSRPGRYFVNTWAPETRTRYEAQVLAFHESIPGHHLQIALAQELEHLPRIRRHTGSTAFVEGWALYTERLCDELGLYESDVDRLGMLSYRAWRACRLVVDTGVHSLGWSRQRAVDYMVDNTLLAENNVANEVDRYIAWPGQALAYKLGEREILSLRARAREALGPRFDLAEFHDRVLENGAVTLSVLRARIEEWIAERAGVRG